MKQLAIIIPAYKGDFFENTLHSLAKQTNKNFKVYIGIDASPYNFERVIQKYSNIIDIYCVRFQNNLGGKDLVAQWKRCIDLSKDEPWIWLFSDDDYLHPECVDSLLKELENNIENNLYHFNVEVVDERNIPIKDKGFVKRKYPEFLTSIDYIKQRLHFRINSFVVEYIFSRKVYEKYNGFVSFDLAWGSDDASWANFSRDGVIKTLPRGCVYWRCSSTNISPDLSPNIAYRKAVSSLKFVEYLINLYGEKVIVKDCIYFILRRLCNYCHVLTSQQIKEILIFLMNNILKKQIPITPIYYLFILCKSVKLRIKKY